MRHPSSSSPATKETEERIITPTAGYSQEEQTSLLKAQLRVALRRRGVQDDELEKYSAVILQMIRSGMREGEEIKEVSVLGSKREGGAIVRRELGR